LRWPTLCNCRIRTQVRVRRSADWQVCADARCF
jgi:hypothetical protein